MTNNPHQWPQSLDDRFTELFLEGKSFREIGDIIGKSRNACIGKSHRLGLTRSLTQKQPREVKLKAPLPEKIDDVPMVACPEFESYVVLPLMAGLQISDLTDKNCHWPFGDPGQSDFHFCGDIAEEGRPYCRAHFKLGTVPRKPRVSLARRWR